MFEGFLKYIGRAYEPHYLHKSEENKTEFQEEWKWEQWEPWYAVCTM